jgi:hypothetical protein
MVKTIKTWETVYFEASKRGVEDVRVELSFNRQTKEYTLCTKHEESVSFNGDTIEQSKLKLEAVSAALKYIEKQLKDDENNKI